MDKVEKVTIRSAELEGEPIPALFNPKDLGIDKSVPWQQQPNSQRDVPAIEFTTGAPRTFSLELFADLYEERHNRDVYIAFVSKLERYVMIEPTLSRPPIIEIVWGKFPAFRGVVEGMNVKYTMFLSDGTPCRATVSLKIKEAHQVTAKPAPSAGKKSQVRPRGALSQGDQRMDQLAAATGCRNPRAVADASGLDNMSSIPAGTPIIAATRC